MSLYNVPALPRPLWLNGQVSIPPPSAENFNTSFGGLLPPAQTATSYWGVTTYYIISPSHPNPSPSAIPRNVVLVHGVGTPAIGLLPLATRLAASSTPTTVLIYDLWGHGLSSTPLSAHVPGLFHAQILHLLSHLQWPRAHFLGYSLGGSITTSFAQYHASLVQSLILVAPAGLRRKSNLSAWQRFVQWGGWGWGWEGIAARRVYAWIGPGPVEDDWERNFKDKGLDAVPKNAIQVWERENHAGHVASMVGAYRCNVYDAHDAYKSVAKGDIATMVLLGEHDDFWQVDYMQNELKLLAWRGKVQVVNGVGHAVISGKLEEVERSVLEFWHEL